MYRRRCLFPAAARSVRMARAGRPWRPMTLPRSLGATISSMTVAWSRLRVRMSTSSGSSTSDLARNSMSSFTSSCGSGRLRQLLEQRLHGRRELCALAHPVVDALAVDLDVGRVLLWVVVADLLHRRRARRLQRVGDDDAVERGMGRAATAQANLEHSNPQSYEIGPAMLPEPTVERQPHR